jgi:hypothetical protein
VRKKRGRSEKRIKKNGNSDEENNKEMRIV